MPALRCADGLVADVAIYLVCELLVAEAERHGIGGQTVEEFWGGDALEVVGFDGEASDDGIGDVGVSAPFADANSKFAAGVAYVLYGPVTGPLDLGAPLSHALLRDILQLLARPARR